jgi:hypothetical protein
MKFLSLHLLPHLLPKVGQFSVESRGLFFIMYHLRRGEKGCINEEGNEWVIFLT